MGANDSFTRALTRLVVIATVCRCVIACLVHLGNDEAYYFTYALQPDWNHFDHPPLVGLFIRLLTLDLHWVNDFSMRLTSIIAAAAGTWYIAQCGRMIRNERTGLIAALLFTASLFTSIIAGVFIIPDSPQLVFWILSLYWMLRLAGSPGQYRPVSVLWLGLWIGLACMCKVHGVFLWVGFGAYVVCYDRKWLKNPYFYVAILITACIVSPVLSWNIDNHFITWRYHSARVAVRHNGINFPAFITMLAGQFIYNNPVNVVLAVMAVIAAIRRQSFLPVIYTRLLLCCSLPLIVVATGISLFRSTLPHWSGPGFTGLLLLSAAWLDWKAEAMPSFPYRRWMRAALGFIMFAIIAGIAVVQLYPGTLSPKKTPKLGKGDTSLDMYGWNELNRSFRALRNADIREGLMTAGSPLLVNKWFPGGHLCLYVAFPDNIRIVGEGELDDLHKFVWLNTQQGYIRPGENAYFISPSNYYTDPAIVYKDCFRSITLAAAWPQTRGGKPARIWYVYRLRGATRQLGTLLQP